MQFDDEREVFPFPGKVKSSVWEFFGFYKDDSGILDKSRAICKLCRKATSYSGNTTNLRTHIIHRHKDIAAFPDINYLSRAQVAKSTSTHEHMGLIRQYQTVTSPDHTSRNQRQAGVDEILIPPLSSDISNNFGKTSQHNSWVVETAPVLEDSQSMYRKESPGQENSSCGSFVDSEIDLYGGGATVNDCVFETVIFDLVPIEAVNSPRFRRLIMGGKKHLTIPTTKEMTDKILRKHSELINVVNNDLSQATHTSLKLDVWESGDTTFMTVSVQALFSDWKMRCYVICTEELKKDFTDADVEKVLSKDSFNICLKGNAILSDKLTVIEEMAAGKDAIHIVALCNTINNVAYVCFEETVGRKLCEKVQNVVQFFNGNTTARSVLSEKQRILHFATGDLVSCAGKNWETCLQMFESVLVQSNAIIAAFKDGRVKSLCSPTELSSSDFALIQTLIDMLLPLKTALSLTKDMIYPTAAVILPVLKKLEISLSCKVTDSSQIVDLKTKMVATLKQCYEVPDKKRFLLLCSLLDPRFKGLKFVSQADQDAAFEQLKQEAMTADLSKMKVDTKPDLPNKLKVKIEVVDELDESQGTFDMYLKNSDDESDISLHKAKRQKLSTSQDASGTGSTADDWFADVIQEARENQSEEDGVVVEIHRYKAEMQISSGLSPLTWWRDRQNSFPLLSQVARRYVMAPGLMSNTNEATENWYRRQRRCLPANLIDSVVFLHNNYETIRGLSQ